MSECEFVCREEEYIGKHNTIPFIKSGSVLKIVPLFVVWI